MNIQKIKDLLIEDWDKAYKYFSVKLNLIAIILLGLLTQMPDQLLASWTLVPDEIKSNLTPALVGQISIGLFILTTIGRLVKQSTPIVKQAEADAAVKPVLDEVKKAQDVIVESKGD